MLEAELLKCLLQMLQAHATSAVTMPTAATPSNSVASANAPGNAIADAPASADTHAEAHAVTDAHGDPQADATPLATTNVNPEPPSLAKVWERLAQQALGMPNRGSANDRGLQALLKAIEGKGCLLSDLFDPTLPAFDRTLAADDDRYLDVGAGTRIIFI